MSTLRTAQHYAGCPRAYRPAPKVKCGHCGGVTTLSEVKYGVFPHHDNAGTPTHTGLVVRTGHVEADGSVFYGRPYNFAPVAEYDREPAAQRFADKANGYA